MRTRISDELQIDATTYATEIDRAIFSATRFYEDKDFWFLDTSPALFIASATTRYSLDTIIPGRSAIQYLVLHLSPGRPELTYRTLSEMLELDYDENFTGQPTYWTVDNNEIFLLPKPQQTRTVEVYHSLRRSMTACASASTVWTNEAEELIRLHAEIDLLENRIKDYDEAMRKTGRLVAVLKDLDEKTVVRRGTQRIKPFM